MSKLGLNAFAVDVEAEEDGIWTKVGDMEFLIARIGNDNWKRVHKNLENKQYGSTKRRGKNKQNEDIDVELMMKCLAQTCILDWRDVELDNEEVPYSIEKCTEILLDSRFKPLALHLLELAGDEERYMEEEIKEDEEAAKN